MTKDGSWLARHAALWLVPVSILVTFLLGEGVLRFRPELLPETVQIKRLYRLQTKTASIGDPYLGFVYPPHYRAEIESLDFTFQVESDEHGFRNATHWPAQADIVVAGDSMVYGWGVEKEQAWVNIVAERLPGTRIVNLGLPGASPQQYLRYFERFGVGLKPKLLVFGLFAGNDLLGAEVFDRWVAAGSPGNFNEWRFFEGRPPGGRERLFERSLLLQTINATAKNISEQYGSRTIQVPDGGELQLVPSVYERTMRLAGESKPAFQSLVRSAVMARDLARANGIDLLVVLFPTKEAVYLPLRNVAHPSLSEPIAEALSARGIEVLDLTEPLRQIAAQGETLFFRIDGHPNVAGNRVIAAILLSRLRLASDALADPARGDD